MSLSKMNYSYAVVELKYESGKHLIVKVKWIMNLKPNYSKTQDFFCFWLPDFEDSPELNECSYSKTFNGLPSLFKVFVVQLTNSIEEAQKYLEGRIKMVAKRFREPGDTEEEIKKMETKKKRNSKKELKEQKANAHAKNIEYLFDGISENSASNIDTSDLPSTSMSTGPIHEPLEPIASTSFDEFVYDLMKDDEMNPVVFEDEDADNETQEVVPIKIIDSDPAVPPSQEQSICSSYDEYDQLLLNQSGVDDEIVGIAQTEKSTNEESEVHINIPLSNASNTPSMVDGTNFVVINFDELTTKCEILTKENEELKQKNLAFKEELDGANKRNLLLQNYLVAADERVAQTIFIEKDGGRLYRGGVFLNEKQCAVLDKAKSDREYLNILATCIFGRKVLETSSITGVPSNRSKGKKGLEASSITSADKDVAKVKGKLKLDKDLLQLTYDIMDARSVNNKTEKLSKVAKNAIVGKKCTNAASAAEVYAAKLKT